MMNNLDKGSYGERLAELYLKNKGYMICERNYRNFIGEIDLICRKDKNLIFVEVKSRTNLNYGYPFEAVTGKKRKKILKTSLFYLKDKNIRDYQLRYDIIEIYLKSKKVNHIKNAF